MKRYSLRKAVSEAIAIRNELLMEYVSLEIEDRSDMLIGACGLASVLLSIRLEDVGILRYGNSDSFGHHIWTEVNNVIIDITACQFNGIRTSTHHKVDGVLVTKFPKPYHSNIRKTGMDVYLMVLNENWYTKEDYTNWPSISEHFL